MAPYKKLTFFQSIMHNDLKSEYFCPLNKLYYYKENSGHSYGIIYKILEYMEKREGKNIFIYFSTNEHATYFYKYICASKAFKASTAIYLVDRSINRVRFKNNNIRHSIFIGRLRALKSSSIIPDLLIMDRYEQILNDDNLTYFMNFHEKNKTVQFYFFSSEFSAKIFSRLSFLNRLKKFNFHTKEYRIDRIHVSYENKDLTFFDRFNRNILRAENEQKEGLKPKEIVENRFHVSEYSFPIETKCIPVFMINIMRAILNINNRLVIFLPNFSIDFVKNLIEKNRGKIMQKNILSDLNEEEINARINKIEGGEKLCGLKIYAINKKMGYEEMNFILETFNSENIEKTILLMTKKDISLNCNFYSAINLFDRNGRIKFVHKELNKNKQLNLNKYEGQISSTMERRKEENEYRTDSSIIFFRENSYEFDLNYPSIINIPYKVKGEMIRIEDRSIQYDEREFANLIRVLEKHRMKNKFI